MASADSRWAAISAARRSAIASEGLSPRDGLACTISSGAEKLPASRRGRRLRQRLGLRTQPFGCRYLDREATYVLGLRNRFGQWPTGVDLVASVRLVVEFRQRRRDLRAWRPTWIRVRPSILAEATLER